MVDKVSFVRLPFTADVARLEAEVQRLGSSAWQRTYWPYPHGTVELVLLRGGTTNTAADFYCEDVADRPILATLPYLAELVGPAGPFGGVHFAFLFRMSPHGVAKLHQDAHPIWVDLHRVHIAIETTPACRLITGDRRAQHFGLGQAWTFDNQAHHGAVGGPGVRTHLILDVPATNPAMAELMRRATVSRGEPATEEEWARLW